MTGEKRKFAVVTEIRFDRVAQQLRPGGWAVADHVQNVKDLVDEIENSSALYLLANECLKKLQAKYESDEKIYSAKVIERTFDDSNIESSALKSFNTRAENGRTKAKALGKIIRLINLVQSAKQGDIVWPKS